MMRPSIQRSTEQTRVWPAAVASTVVAPSVAVSASGTHRSVPALIASEPGDLRADRR